MRLRWGRSSDAEDRFEKWIAQQHERRVLAGETTPAGPHPDEEFLRDLARKSKKISLSDPRVDHAATCPTCMNRLLALREEYRFHGRQRVWIGSVIAACAIIAIALVVWRVGVGRKPSNSTAVIAQTVNLFDTGVVRGEQPQQLQSVSLPAALIRLTIVLPRHSAPGQYLIAITRDQNGNGVVAEGLAASSGVGNQQEVTANLDLRSATAGQYFLSTTHEQDQAAYYYPLRIEK
jgi:hypothetical protein